MANSSASCAMRRFTACSHDSAVTLLVPSRLPVSVMTSPRYSARPGYGEKVRGGAMDFLFSPGPGRITLEAGPGG